MMSIGQLVAVLFAKYEKQFHDHELAAVATQVELDELLRRAKRSKAGFGFATSVAR